MLAEAFVTERRGREALQRELISTNAARDVLKRELEGAKEWGRGLAAELDAVRNERGCDHIGLLVQGRINSYKRAHRLETERRLAALVER